MLRTLIFCAMAAVFLSGTARVLAHGGVLPQEAIYPATQIGLPEMEQAGDQGLTRDEIVEIVREDQESEKARSTVKFTVLILFILGIAYIFYPKKPSAVTAGGADISPGPVPQAQAPSMPK